MAIHRTMPGGNYAGGLHNRMNLGADNRRCFPRRVYVLKRARYVKRRSIMNEFTSVSLNDGRCLEERIKGLTTVDNDSRGDEEMSYIPDRKEDGRKW